MSFKLSFSFTQYVPKFSDASARIKNKQLIVRQSNFHARGISTIFYILYTRGGNGSPDAPEFDFNSNLQYISYFLLLSSGRMCLTPISYCPINSFTRTTSTKIFLYIRS